jgi:hypothetical protein
VGAAASDFHKCAHHRHTKKRLGKHARVGGASGPKLEGENHAGNWADAERDARRDEGVPAAAALHIYVMKDLSLACQVAR